MQCTGFIAAKPASVLMRCRHRLPWPDHRSARPIARPRDATVWAVAPAQPDGSPAEGGSNLCYEDRPTRSASFGVRAVPGSSTMAATRNTEHRELSGRRFERRDGRFGWTRRRHTSGGTVPSAAVGDPSRVDGGALAVLRAIAGERPSRRGSDGFTRDGRR